MGASRRRSTQLLIAENETAPQVVEAPPAPTRAVQQLLTKGAGPATKTDVRGLQRMAGNGATRELVQRLAIQRDDDDLVGGTDKVLGGLDPMAPLAGQTAGAWNLSNAWNQSTDSVGGTNEAGLSSAVIGTPVAIAGVVTSGVGHHRAKQDMKTARTGAGEDSGEFHEARRRRDITGGNIAQNVMKTTSGAADITGGAMNVAGHAAASVGTAVAAFITVPLNFFQMIREAVRAEKARKRVAAIENQLQEWSAPERKVPLAAEQVSAAEEALDSARDLVSAKQRHYDQMKVVVKNQPSQRPQLAKALTDLEQAKRWLSDAQAAHAEAVQRHQDALTAKQQMEDAVKTAATGKPTLHDIAAYAITKNKAGHFKKAMSSVGAALGVAGGVVLGVAAAAGGAALMATPFGWGLAAAAALVGVGLASYKAWKFFSKRWARTDPTKSKGTRLKETLMFWKGVGKSKRETYADELYDLATATGPQQAEAKKLLQQLGITDIRGDAAKVKALIAAKLAS